MQQPILPSVSQTEFSARLETEILGLIRAHTPTLQPQYQNLDWTTAIAAEKLNRAIAPRLQTFETPTDALHWVQASLLSKLFQTEFLDPEHPHSIHNALLARLNLSSREPSEQPGATPQLKASASESGGIAVLLLDAENLQLKAEEERFLQQNCPYPIQVKLAFANWRKLGKLDQALHARSYDLIHVPSGKDHADGKMIAMGTGIHERFPQTRAVLICSSDSIMTSLCSQLAKNKITAYQVIRTDKGLLLSSGFNGDREEAILPKPIGLSLNQVIASLARITAAECQRTCTPIARFTQVAAEFSAQHQLSLKEVALHYQKGDKALHFLKAHPDKFKLHQLGQPPTWFVELLESEPASSQKRSASEPASTSITTDQTTSPSSTSPIRSSKNLKSALLQCLQQQTSDTQPEVIVGAIAASFRRTYGESISAVLTRLQLSKKLITFLSQQPEFVLRKDGNRWWVSSKAIAKRD